MSFLTSLMGAGGAGAAAGAAGGAAAANPLANGLGHLLGAEGSQVSNIADRIGTGMNQIATAGGAQPGYAAPAQPAQPAAPQGDPNNHMQLLDPDVLQGLIARFRPTAGMETR